MQQMLILDIWLGLGTNNFPTLVGSNLQKSAQVGHANSIQVHGIPPMLLTCSGDDARQNNALNADRYCTSASALSVLLRCCLHV